MKGYEVKINSHCDESWSEPEQYGSWRESYTNSFQRVSKVDKHPDASMIDDIAVGEMCYVVWAEWSSGDSFGNSENGSTDVLAVFKNSDDARGLTEACKKLGVKSSYGDANGYKFTASTGQKFACGFASWSGYFESLTDIHIEFVPMQ